VFFLSLVVQFSKSNVCLCLLRLLRGDFYNIAYLGSGMQISLLKIFTI
jgi:hypothetical protein